MQVKIEASWQKLLQNEFEKPYFEELTNFVKNEYQSKSIYPEPGAIFRAFDLVPVEKVKVVILGQDPYHTPGVADGLAFSTKKGNRVPPSLQNIYKEIIAEFGYQNYDNINNPNLTRWSEQGVLLLNTSLTVEKGLAASHSKIGWEKFTDKVIEALGQSDKPLVFILWGAHARSKKELIDTTKHLILESAHPSPFSADKGFFGNNHFKLCNEYLKENEIGEITW